MTDTENDYADLRPAAYSHRKGYYDNLRREDLIAACERKDRNIARLDQMMIVMEQRWHLALSESARLKRQINRLWLIAERDLAGRESSDSE